MALYQIKKRWMAIAGMVLTAYLLFHMLSNLTFINPATYEAFYAFYNHPLVRWPLWLMVSAALLLHVIVAVQIRLKNGAARQHAYHHRQHHWIPAWLVSTVITLILVFIVWHMVQMWSFEGEGLYDQTRVLFGSIWQVIFYLLGISLLALHLHHALLNVLQTLGKTSTQFFWAITLFVVLMTIGFAAVPLIAYWTAG